MFKRRLTSLLKGRSSQDDNGSVDDETPEQSTTRGVRLFCESGGPNNSGEEVLHLPTIVDGAESSPAAAKEAAKAIRRFLTKDQFNRAYLQYNAIMLIGILADNPGKTFTRHIDDRFTSTLKDILREGRDMSVQQILQETLDRFETQKAEDENLAPLINMWKAEKAKWSKRAGVSGQVGSSYHFPTHSLNSEQGPGTVVVPPAQQQQNYFPQTQHQSRLPPPHELASRIEEARTSAKLLVQVVQSTASHEVIGNELIKEFGDRCQSASRSIQAYMNASNPAPDQDTLLTLIETNDQLSMALSKHQRAILQARTVSSREPSPGPVLGAPSRFTVHAAPSPSTDVQDAALRNTAPVLSTQSPQARLENPFDDSHNLVNAGPEPAVPDLRQDTLSVPQRLSYQPTQSYVRRQENSANNVTMHGAGGEAADEPESPEKPRRYRF